MYDPSYGVGNDDPFLMGDPQEVESRRMHTEMALNERTMNPDRFWWIRDNETPTVERESYGFGYNPGVGESGYPTVMVCDSPCV